MQCGVRNQNAMGPRCGSITYCRQTIRQASSTYIHDASDCAPCFCFAVLCGKEMKMKSRSRGRMIVIVGFLMFGGGAGGALIGVNDYQARMAEAQVTAPPDTALPAVLSHTLGRLKTESGGVAWSDGVFRGEVTDVSLSAYNTPNGEYAPEIETWNGDELVEEFIPHRYYTV